MTSQADIHTLIAAFHPHVLTHRSKYNGLVHPVCLKSSEDTKDVRMFAQAFATLFSYHPGCEVTALAVQTSPSKDTSLHIAVSPSPPREFERNVKEWLMRFVALCNESKSAARDAPKGDTLSPAETSLILHTYRVCYPAMRQRATDHRYGDWDAFVNNQAGADNDNPNPPNEEYTHELQCFSNLVQQFAEYISRGSLANDEDVLRFHKLCMSIRNMMLHRGFSKFLDENIYCSGARPKLAFFSPPFALSTLLTLSQRPKITFVDKWSPSFMNPSGATQHFGAVIAARSLHERFGVVPGIRWAKVEGAFEDFAGRQRRYRTSTIYEWNAETKSLSTTQPVSMHPEIVLIQHLVEKGEGSAEVYIACSRPPCYASVMYATAVNQALAKRLTMDDVGSRGWGDLYKAEPWILPGVTSQDVLEKTKELLLQDLKTSVNLWVGYMWMNGYIASGFGDLDWEGC